MGLMHRNPLAKLTQLNWMLLISMLLMMVIGVAMMVSAAGGSFSPWASRQIIHCCFASVLMLAIALTPSSFLLRYAYVIYTVCLIVLIGIEVAGFMGKGAK